MICPHCEKNLLHRERVRGTCPKCKRAFALEPKDNPLRLHDVRMRKLIWKLGNGEGLRYTPVQLWYAAARNRTPVKGTSYGCVGAFLTAVISAVSLVIIAVTRFDPAIMVFVLVGAVLLTALLLRMTVRAARRAKWTGTVRVPMAFEHFRTSVIDRWTRVYGAPPPGLTDESDLRFPIGPDGRPPKLVLLCPDRTVLAFLALNGAHRRHPLALAQSVDQLGTISTGTAGEPAPVGIVLHDASPAGLAFASAARSALGGRVVVAGMLPRTVMDRTTALRLRKPLVAGDLEAIRTASALTEAEADWLSRGWWSPIAAVPPAKLLAVLDRAVDRAEGIADPDRGRAQQVGFLTWPTAS